MTIIDSPPVVPQYRFAQQVKILGVLYRERNHNKCWWERTHLTVDTIGIVIRKVTLSNGIYHPSEQVFRNEDVDFEDAYYEPLEHFTAYEVAYSLSRKTVLVHCEDLEACE